MVVLDAGRMMISVRQWLSRSNSGCYSGKRREEDAQW